MNGLAVGFVDGNHATQMTLVLRRTMGENVTLGSVATLDGTARADLKALARSLLSFHLRHFGRFPFKLSRHQASENLNFPNFVLARPDFS